jgi:hypothetical protein
LKSTDDLFGDLCLEVKNVVFIECIMKPSNELEEKLQHVYSSPCFNNVYLSILVICNCSHSRSVLRHS